MAATNSILMQSLRHMPFVLRKNGGAGLDRMQSTGRDRRFHRVFSPMGKKDRPPSCRDAGINWRGTCLGIVSPYRACSLDILHTRLTNSLSQSELACKMGTPPLPPFHDLAPGNVWSVDAKHYCARAEWPRNEICLRSPLRLGIVKICDRDEAKRNSQY